MKLFEDLKYQGRAARLRQLALNALKEYDLNIKKVSLITIDTNGVFRVDTQDGQKFVIRITDPFGGHDRIDIKLELSWMQAIRNETDIRLPQPLPARDGQLVVQASAEGVPEPRLCVVFHWVPGVNLEDRFNEETVHRMGQLSAKLHQHGATFKIPQGTPLRNLGKIFPYCEPGFNLVEPFKLFNPEFSAWITPQRRSVFEKTIEQVEGFLKTLYSDQNRARILHHDLHLWNVKVHRGQLYVIDFEDLIWGFPEQDIATTLYYFPWEDNFNHWKSIFKQGYESMQPYPIKDDMQLETMLVARRLLLTNDLLNLDTPEYREMIPRSIERTSAHFERFLAGEVTG